MKTMFDALYNYASGQDDLTHWLLNEDIVDTYRQDVEFSRSQKEQLLTGLSEKDRVLFQKFLGNIDDAHQLETEMLFYQGLAMGIHLGTLSLWA